MHWELLSGGRFVAATGYDGRVWHATETACDPIGLETQPVIRGIVLHQASQTFIAVFQYRRGDWHGFGYATSADLMRWSVPRPLLQASLAADAGPREGYGGYPSIIDGNSGDRNFGTVGETARLVFVRFGPSGQRSFIRKLVSVPLRIDP